MARLGSFHRTVGGEVTGGTVPWFPGWVWAGAYTGAQHGPNGYAGHLVDTSGLTLCVVHVASAS